MCVYDMFDDPCEQQRDWRNCYVSVSDIGMETASSSTVQVHNASRYWNSAVLYWISLHGTTGTNLYKVVLEQYRTRTTVFTERLSLYETYILLYCLWSDEH